MINGMCIFIACVVFAPLEWNNGIRKTNLLVHYPSFRVQWNSNWKNEWPAVTSLLFCLTNLQIWKRTLRSLLLWYSMCSCSTGRRCHSARTAYEKMNRYAAKSPRRFGGTSPALPFRMCCVSTAYRWRMGDAHAAHMAYEWRCHCVWCRVWELDHCVFTAQVAYAQRTSHVRAAVNAILWRMAGVCTAHGLRTCRTYKYISLYVSCECDI